MEKIREYNLGDIFKELPKKKEFQEGIRRAPKREFVLTESETELALKNALRYIPAKWHEELAPEFLEEFHNSHVYLDFLQSVPIKLNTNEESGLLGAGFYAAQLLEG